MAMTDVETEVGKKLEAIDGKSERRGISKGKWIGEGGLRKRDALPKSLERATKAQRPP